MTRRSQFGAGLSAIALAAAALALPAQAGAKDDPVSLRNGFRIGNAGVACSAQNAPNDPRLSGMFDRAYRLTCRDAASAIGSLVVLRQGSLRPFLPSVLPAGQLACDAATATEIDGIGSVSSMTCHDTAAGIDHRRYAIRRGNATYLVEGLAGYDPALRLALASVVNDRAMPGEIRVATTEVSDAAAFARVQAGQLDAAGVRGEAYLRNNGGRFAEASEFFESLAGRDHSQNMLLSEALANQGLQQSNLGNFPAAELLFSRSAAAMSRRDGVAQRLLRNFRAINQLNQRRPVAALRVLAAQVEPINARFDIERVGDGFINASLADQINRENTAIQRLGGIDPGLTAIERAEILDAQADALGATATRQQGRLDEAANQFVKAARRLDGVRDGRVTSVRWLRSEIEIEQALIAETQGRASDAAGAFDRAIAVIGEAFPQSPSLLAAKARKAAFLGRSGDAAGARALYAQVVDDSALVPDGGVMLRDLLRPYFVLLANDGGAEAATAMFTASQVLQRPGVAQTQAVLARQFSEGNDEAAALFRLSLARTREIARTEVDVARLTAIASPSPQDLANLGAAQGTLAELQREQTGLVSRLSAFPRFSALAPTGVTLAELQGALKPGEAYYKLMIVGSDVYGLFATDNFRKLFRIAGTADDLSQDVQTVRDSVVQVVNGQTLTYPFDLERSRALYLKLFGAIDADIPQVRHLIFEPDGAMLQLPAGLLVTQQAGVDAYKRRMTNPDADDFNFTGIAWLARGREMSVAVSPRGFLASRNLAPSQATRSYLGVGQNTIPAAKPVAAVADECQWPLATWQHPISADELVFASGKLNAGGSDVRTDTAFSDTALLADNTLDSYRILHFATHGLVTAPRPDCPAQPALVTSFGASGSDGLLSFREIFDLKLNADLVILSACDTAGFASVGASRDAGITTGGNYALDGLVRAFVGAGARSVIASHWPVPDDFGATKRLISGMIDGRPGQPVADSLAGAQAKLMDDASTSHPFYWSAFIILGDGAKPLSRPSR